MEKKNIKNNSMANNSSKGIATPLPREGAGVGSKSVVVAFPADWTHHTQS